MLLLTNCPQETIDFLPAELSFEPQRIETLDPSTQRVWEALGGSPRLWTQVVPTAAGSRFWTRAFLLAEAGRSQFDVMRELLAGGLPLAGPVACLAFTGRGFHGHRGRSWQATLGNLHLTLALAPAVAADRLGLGLTMLPAVAAVDVLNRLGLRIKPRIKWVNDVVVSGRKVGGVLTAAQTQGNRLGFAVLGIGINLAVVPPVRPTPFVPAVGSLWECVGQDKPSLAQLFWDLLATLRERYLDLVSRGPDPLFRAYQGHSLVLGRRVRIWEEGLVDDCDPSVWPDPVAVGIVEALRPDLSLILRGRQEPIVKGRLALEESCQKFNL
jgi:biotin-[acetyl-CoA-carboxylase] ligase BirA-like protein